MSFLSRLFSGGASTERVDGSSARQLVEGGALLLDVRTPVEFASGHIDGARNLPLDQLGRRMGEVPEDRAVVVYCRSGARSANAARQLSGGGKGPVHDLGPMSAWR